MFKLSQSDTYTWPVTIQIPQDGGKWSKQVFTGVFKRLPQTRLQEIGKQEGVADIDLAKELMCGWQDVTDDDGPVEFTSSTFDRLLDVPGVAAAIIMAFFESVAGAKRKN